MNLCMTTLCYIEKDDSYLMIHRTKKEQDINKDKWMGVGGHFEVNESPEDCVLREVMEETGLRLTSYRFRGMITFVTTLNEMEYICLYTADGFDGDLIECTEGDLEWVPKSKLKELNLWEGDYVFLELLEKRDTFFSLKLCYEKDKLVKAVLDGEVLEI